MPTAPYQITGYRVESASTPDSLQTVLNTLLAENWTLREIIPKPTGYTLVVAYREERAMHEFRPREDGSPVCMFCHHIGPVPWHTNPPGRTPHTFKLADAASPDYIACAVCALYPEHPLHRPPVDITLLQSTVPQCSGAYGFTLGRCNRCETEEAQHFAPGENK